MTRCDTCVAVTIDVMKTDESHEERREKENMDQPQEEFISDMPPSVSDPEKSREDASTQGERVPENPANP